jgi:hypothetical protein
LQVNLIAILLRLSALSEKISCKVAIGYSFTLAFAPEYKHYMSAFVASAAKLTNDVIIHGGKNGS